METKEKILTHAIRSFNEHGVKNTTSRHIAREMGISVGNLNYHYKNKEEILLAIYEQMRSDISEVYIPHKLDPFIQFNELLIALEELHNKYSFFHLDLLEILRNHASVEVLLKKTLLLRKEQLALFFQLFVEYEYIKPETKQGKYMRLQHIMRILITFWKSQEEILLPYSEESREDMRLYIWELLQPYMTKKGLLAYKNIP